MVLRDWRERARFTPEGLAKRLSLTIGADVSARSLARIEAGQTQCPTDIAEALTIITGGEVTACDLHDIRVAYMRAHGGLTWIDGALPRKRSA